MVKPILTKEQKLMAQNKNNQTVMNIMWFVFLCVWGLVLILKDVQWKIFSLVIATWIFIFIDSLSKSIRMNNIILLIEEKTKEE